MKEKRTNADYCVQEMRETLPNLAAVVVEDLISSNHTVDTIVVPIQH